MNKKNVLFFILSSISCAMFAQSIHVGDTIMVKPTVRHYLTGERISTWVYDIPHTISQVGSSYYPNGVLLNIEGARSWLGNNDVTPITAQEPLASSFIQHDTLYLPTQPEIVYIHDTIMYTEIQVDTIRMMEQKSQPTRFQLNGNLVCLGGVHNFGIGGELIFGARLSDFAFVGAGVGVNNTWFGLDEHAVHGIQIPVFVNVKAYLPIRQKYYPYCEMSAGVNMGKLSNGQSEIGRTGDFYTGLHASAGIGIDIKAFSLGIGYQYGSGCSSIENDLHHAYLHIGFCFMNNK